jgi:hypothetical protein
MTLQRLITTTKTIVEGAKSQFECGSLNLYERERDFPLTKVSDQPSSRSSS